MTSTSHAIITILLCQITLLLTYHKSPQLIGFLFGPSAQLTAETTADAQNYPEYDPWEDDLTRADAVCELIYRPSYDKDVRASIMRDAGMLASVFAVLLSVGVFGGGQGGKTGQSAVHESQSSLLRFALLVSLSSLLYVAPALMGQILYLRSIPVEISLVRTWGIKNGMFLGGHCSMQSLMMDGFGGVGSLSSGGSVSFLMSMIIHDLKVVCMAGIFVFLFLGRMPDGK